MAELSCRCGNQKKTFKYLDKKDMPEGWECENCPNMGKKTEEIQPKFKEEFKEKAKSEILEEPKEDKEEKAYDFAPKKKRRGRPKKEKPE